MIVTMQIRLIVIVATDRNERSVVHANPYNSFPFLHKIVPGFG